MLYEVITVSALIRAGMSEGRYREIGTSVIEARGAFTAELDDDIANLTRDTARSFARTEVLPIAQEMHREDSLVPESLIQKKGSSAPRRSRAFAAISGPIP